jgi:cell shape-determining protein MreD
MRALIAFPIIAILIILQTAIVRQVTLLQGSADLVMLVVLSWALQRRVTTAWHWGVIGAVLVSLVSAIPIYVNLLGYLIVVAMALFIRRRFWNVSLIIMFVSTFLASLVTHTLTYLYLRIIDVPMPVIDTINLVIIPSLLLNLLFAVPFYIWMSDLAGWLYPEPLEA